MSARPLRSYPIAAFLGLALLAGCRGEAAAPRAVSPVRPSAPAVAGLRVDAPRTASPRADRRYEPGESPATRTLGTPAGSGPTAEDVRTFDGVNRVRRELGLSPLCWNDRLFRAAYDHSLEQHAYGYMGHGSPTPSRDDLGDRLRLAGFVGSTWAEVVAWGYEGPASVVDGWMRSRGHRKILTDPSLREAAFSRVGDYFTGDFGVTR